MVECTETRLCAYPHSMYAFLPSVRSMLHFPLLPCLRFSFCHCTYKNES